METIYENFDDNTPNKISFNQDYSLISIGTNRGYKIIQPSPYYFHEKNLLGSLSLCEMSYKSNFLALVGGGKIPKYVNKKVVIYNDLDDSIESEYKFANPVLNVKFKKDFIFIVCEKKIYVFNVENSQNIDTFDTINNKRGIIAVNGSKDKTIMAHPIQFEDEPDKGYVGVKNNKELIKEKDIKIKDLEQKVEELKNDKKEKENIIIKSKQLKKEIENLNNEIKKLNKNNSYNIFEMIWSFTSKCCKTKKFENKTNLIKQSNDLIDDKLDIIFYIRNMFLFQSINRIYLENKTIVNFLSSPIIYLDKEKCEEKNKYEQSKINISKISQINDVESSEEGDSNNLRNTKVEQYKRVKELKSDKLNKKIIELLMKNNKTKPETRLINYLERRLEGL